MAIEREVFPTLADTAGVGAALSKAAAGDAATGKIGSVALGFKDSSGNLVLPTLTSDGKLPVSTQSPGTCKSVAAKNTGSLTRVAVGTITLTATKTYSEIAFDVACSRTTLFELIHNNDGSEVELGYGMVGPGQFSHNFYEPCKEFVAGATGTQELIIYGTNIDKASNMYASVSCLEKA